MLSLDEFEQLLVGTTMASSSADDRVARGRMQRMFGKADLNKDGRVDFNEVSCATTQAAQTANRGSYSKRLLPSPPLSLLLRVAVYPHAEEDGAASQEGGGEEDAPSGEASRAPGQ